MSTVKFNPKGTGGLSAGLPGMGTSSGAKTAMKTQYNLAFYVGMKLVAVLFSFAVIGMITNNMAQLYTERVFVEEKAPPHLRNQVAMWAAFSLVTTVLVTVASFALGVTKFVEVDWVLACIYDVLFSFGVGAAILWGVAGTMYTKKYFYYKDDGLRAIRALKDMVNWAATTLLLLPAGIAISKAMGKK